MAERRMFTKKITESDAFLDMPLSTQALYFHLNMNADDEGFVNNAKKIQRMINASDDDMRLLLAKNFIIPFDSGVIVIKHWKMHNYIQKDRFHHTVYQDERKALEVKENGTYTITDNLMYTECIQDASKMDTEVRLGKVSIDKDSIDNTPLYPPTGEEKEKDVPKKSKRFVKPTPEQVQEYCSERGNGITGDEFCDFYESKGWMIGKDPMKDWKAAIRTWERKRGFQSTANKPKRDSKWQ